MVTKTSNIETIDYGLMIANYKFMNIHIDVKASNITYYGIMNTTHNKLYIHEHRHKHGHKTSNIDTTNYKCMRGEKNSN
jgi:hypothetical protein